MLRPPLVECRFLDPRPAAEAARAPIVGAVNMPRSELPARTHELPPRDELIRVVGPPEFAEPAVAWLTSAGRRAAVESAFEYAPPADARLVGRLWRPTAFLAEVCARLSPGRALELACGTGRDAVYLAACGWQVLAVDVLPDALERGQMLAQRCAPALAPVEWRQADLERGVLKLPAGFDLVVAVRYLHRPLFARLPTGFAQAAVLSVRPSRPCIARDTGDRRAPPMCCGRVSSLLCWRVLNCGTAPRRGMAPCTRRGRGPCVRAEQR